MMYSRWAKVKREKVWVWAEVVVVVVLRIWAFGLGRQGLG